MRINKYIAFHLLTFCGLINAQVADFPFVSFSKSMACNKAWIRNCTRHKKRIQVLRDLYEKNNVENVSLLEDPIIPKIIHQVWLGGSFPEKYCAWAESWQKMHPDWEYKLWTDESILALEIHNKDAFDKAPDFAAKVDVLKYEILYQFGGLYVDVDFECLRPFDGLHHRYNFYSGISNEKTFAIALGLLASVPKHPILHHCIHSLSPNKFLPGGRMGPLYFTQKFFEAVQGCDTDGVLILPCSYLYPLPFPRPRNVSAWEKYIKPESLAVHYWEKNW